MKHARSATSSHNFAQVPSASIPRSSFKRDMTWKSTFEAGYLVPIYVDEALPGDTFNLKLNAFARLATPVVPIMDNLYIDFFFFAVPIRLIWEHWVNMNGERDSPVADYSQDTSYIAPQLTAPSGGWNVGTLSDYLSLPTGVSNITVTSFWHRAYNLIWNEWFRDENLQTPAAVPTGDGPDSDSDFVLRRRGKRHDYFTSCLPWQQKGPQVTLPLGLTADVYGTGNPLPIEYKQGPAFYNGWLGFGGNWGQTLNNPSIVVRTSSDGEPPETGEHVVSLTDVADGAAFVGVSPDPDAGCGLYADLATASAAPISAIREAFQLQKLYERDARGGTRYTEILRSHFGVVSPDARLQRPEYLGGGEAPIVIHSVAQTSGTGISSQSTPQGNLSAYGLSATVGQIGFQKSFVEHCVLIGLAEVRADLTYQQGINRMFSRKTRFDWYWPALHNLSEQAVLNKEIYAQGTTADDQAFGYQERWAEYRYGMSRITGELRSSYGQSLDFWHLSQNFGSLPTLNSTFIEDNPPVARCQAVAADPVIIYDSLINLNCVRPMGTFSVPGLIDHL